MCAEPRPHVNRPASHHGIPATHKAAACLLNPCRGEDTDSVCVCLGVTQTLCLSGPKFLKDQTCDSPKISPLCCCHRRTRRAWAHSS